MLTSRNFYRIQSDGLKRLSELLESVITALESVLMGFADNDGHIPIETAPRAISAGEEAILELMTGRRSEPVNHDGQGLSPFALLLLTLLADLERQTLQTHVSFLETHLSSETLLWLRTAPRPERLSGYVPAYRWIPPKGLNLNGRIWTNTLEMRGKLNRYLTYNIRQGTNVTQMVRELRGIILPNKKVLKTTQPLNVDLSYNAYRLLQTEISRGFSDMTFQMALDNPAVTGMDWALNPRHPRVDICDGLATLSLSGARIKDPYPLESAPQVIVDSHPLCLCTNKPYEDLDVLAQLERREGVAPWTVLALGYMTWFRGY